MREQITPYIELAVHTADSAVNVVDSADSAVNVLDSAVNVAPLYLKVKFADEFQEGIAAA